MYCDFYQMRERPFNVTADPKFLYLNARYREALASLHYGITQRKGFITLIGEAGSRPDHAHGLRLQYQRHLRRDPRVHLRRVRSAGAQRQAALHAAAPQYLSAR
jgi:type II secretory pathway predicted ATPase ExeA